MIPKKIHYCWFGHNPKPKLAEKCIKSWKMYCPDYEIIEWNENNFEISSCPLYVRQAYEAQKWAFVTDYVRLKVVYDQGGIYLDTDVELRKNWDHLLKNEAFFGFESGTYIATGLGFGAIAGYSLLKEMMDDYEEIPFVKEDGSFDTLSCPQRNTEVFLRHGLRQDDSEQIVSGCRILPTDYLCPIDYNTGIRHMTKNTLSIHHFSASWISKDVQKCHRNNIRRAKRRDRLHSIIHTPNRIAIRLLGEHQYSKLKKALKRG